MLADLKIFSAKNLPELSLVSAAVGLVILSLTGIFFARGFSPFDSILALAVFGGLLFSLLYVFRRANRERSEAKSEALQDEETKAELADLRRSCAARSLFIETAGAELLETSRAMYEAAGFLHTKRRRDGEQFSGGGIEKGLLENADWVYSFSRDIVELAQLKKGAVDLLEQEIDPVELFRFCAIEVSKKQGNRQIIELVSFPSQPLLINGDLCKLKKLLTKLLICAVGHLQIDGAKVQVDIHKDEESRLVFSVKLAGRHLNSGEFRKLCCPLDNFSDDDDHVYLDMAIARWLALLHGGDIVIHEQSSSGTVLALVLPNDRVSEISPGGGVDPKVQPG